MSTRTLDAPNCERSDCLKIVSDVEACLDQSPVEDGPWLAHLLGKLPSLGGSLAAHFKVEQEGPLYQELPLILPRFAERVDKLASDHRQILEETHSVTERARTMHGAPVGQLHRLKHRLQFLVATIRRHEIEENDVLISAHWSDIGVGD